MGFKTWSEVFQAGKIERVWEKAGEKKKPGKLKARAHSVVRKTVYSAAGNRRANGHDFGGPPGGP